MGNQWGLAWIAVTFHWISVFSGSRNYGMTLYWSDVVWYIRLPDHAWIRLWLHIRLLVVYMTYSRDQNTVFESAFTFLWLISGNPTVKRFFFRNLSFRVWLMCKPILKLFHFGDDRNSTRNSLSMRLDGSDTPLSIRSPISGQSDAKWKSLSWSSF